jgi:hypothetical protein
LRYAGAEQRFHAKFCQLPRSLIGCAFLDGAGLSGSFLPVGQFDQQQLPGNVKDGRDAALPDWNGESHGTRVRNLRAKAEKRRDRKALTHFVKCSYGSHR